MKHLTVVYHVTNLIIGSMGGRLKHFHDVLVYHVTKPYYASRGGTLKHLTCGIPRYKPYHASMGGTLKHLTMVYHVKNLVMAQWEVH